MKTKADKVAYQVNYKKVNRERILAQERERYSDALKLAGKTVKPNKIEKQNIEKVGRTEYQRNYYINKKPPKVVKVREIEEELPVVERKDKLLAAEIESLYEKLSKINPIDRACEEIYRAINNLEIKLTNCKHK